MAYSLDSYALVQFIKIYGKLQMLDVVQLLEIDHALQFTHRLDVQLFSREESCV